MSDPGELIVHPDPQEPAGGYAFFELPLRSLMGAVTPVAIFDAYGERWLGPVPTEGAVPIEPGPWQGDRHSFGPYSVYHHDGADWVRVGPEIVNRLEEYQSLRITVGMEEYAVTWPDDVPPRAGAAALGGIRPVQRRVEPVQPAPAPAAPKAPPPEPAPEPAPEPETAPEIEADTAPAARRRLWPLALLLVLGLAGGGALWWFLSQSEPGTEPATAQAPPEEPALPAGAAPVAAADGCSPAALRAQSGAFAEVGKTLRDCGASVSADTALELAESFAAREDPAALYLIGTLYDGEILDARIEKLIGLTFAADDARAAAYYDRAVQAGSQPARAALAATCTRLSGAQSTLAKGAYDDFCG